MFAIVTVAALVAANVVLSMQDRHMAENDALTEDYRRVEFKKSYDVECKTTHKMQAQFY